MRPQFLDRYSRKKIWKIDSRLRTISIRSIGPYVFTISFCYLVRCPSVSDQKVTVFVVGCWFLVWRIPAANPKNELFRFFFSVDRTKWHGDMKFWIWSAYMIIYRATKWFFNLLKTVSGSVTKSSIAVK